MNKLSLICMAFLFLTSCMQTGNGKSELRPDANTNQVAKTNLNLGIEYLRRGNYEKALEKLDKAKQADPGYHATYNAFGLLYQQLGDPRKAEQNFKKALSLNSNDSATMNNYGGFLCQSNRPDEAEKIFLRAAGNPLYETPEVAITNAGICANQNNHLEDAEQFFRRALKINPNIPAALIHMSQISYNKSNYLSARGYLQRYLEIAQHTPRSLWLGVQIERELGDKDAVSSYSLLLRNNFPDSDETKLLKDSGTR